MLPEQELRWRKQDLGVTCPDETAFFSPNSCLCAALVHLVTLDLSTLVSPSYSYQGDAADTNPIASCFC